MKKTYYPDGEKNALWEIWWQHDKNFQQNLLQATIWEAAVFWYLKTKATNQFSKATINNYWIYILELFLSGLIDKTSHVHNLNKMVQKIVHQIENQEDLNENERRYRCRALIAFTTFLEKETRGEIQKLTVPPHLMIGSHKTKPKLLTINEFTKFIEILKMLSFREYLIINTTFLTARNIAQILDLKITDLDFAKSGISFDEDQNKVFVKVNTKHMNELATYITSTQPIRKNNIVFITNRGNPVLRTNFYGVFSTASQEANLDFLVSFRMVQWAKVINEILKKKDIKTVMKEFELQKLPKNIEALAGK